MIERPFYIKKIKPFVDKSIIKVLVGIRRSGKSFIMGFVKELLLERGVPENQIVEVNFESRMLPFAKTVDDIYTFIKAKAVKVKAAKNPQRTLYLLFDEIQEVEGWETLINAVSVAFKVDVYLTGSNAKLLSGELATYLSGRYVEIHVYPLSFSEVLPCYQATDAAITVRDAFRKYVREGGLPFVHDAGISGEVYRAYVTDVFNSVLLKDIAKRHKIRDVDMLERILSYLIMEVGHLFSAQSVVKFLRHENRSVSLETLYNYLKYANEACLALTLKRNDLVGKQLLSSQEKVYLADHGFREALFGNNEACIDQILENIVAVDLVRRGYNVTVGLVGGKEVDFVAERAGRKIYIQVAYLMPTQEVRDREFSVLEMIADNYPKYVLSMDEVDFSRNGIIHEPIYQFLLDGR